MKTKKLISVFLVAVMLIVPLALVSNAASVYTMSNGPLKTVYTDGESFNPQGIVLKNGAESIEYSPLDEKFKFDPALNELLTVDNPSVRVFYNNEYVTTINIEVNHTAGALVSFGDKLASGHGHYCEGCGKVLDKENHKVTEWIPNDDKGFFVQQTETGVCTVCGQKITRVHGEYKVDANGNETLIPGTDHYKFKEIFDYSDLTETESKIIGAFQLIVVSLVQAIVGAN